MLHSCTPWLITKQVFALIMAWNYSLAFQHLHQSDSSDKVTLLGITLCFAPYGCISWTRSHLHALIDHTFRRILEFIPWSTQVPHSFSLSDVVRLVGGCWNQIPISFGTAYSLDTCTVIDAYTADWDAYISVVIMLTSHLRTLTNVFHTFKLHFTLYINPVVHPFQ